MPRSTAHESEDLSHSDAEPESLASGPIDASAHQNAGELSMRRELGDDAGGGSTQLDELIERMLGQSGAAALTGELTAKNLQRWGKRLVERMITEVGASVRGQLPRGSSLDAMVAEVTARQMSAETRTLLDRVFTGEDGRRLEDALRRLGADSPQTALLGLLAAVAYVSMHDMPLPTLTKRLNLGSGFDLSASVGMGSLKDIALKSISARIGYASPNLQASAEYTRNIDRTKLVDGSVGDSTVTDQLRADVAYQASTQLGMGVNMTSSFRDGQLVQGQIGATALYRNGSTTISGSITQTFGADRGLGASFTMQLDNNLTVEGRYHERTGVWAGIVYRKQF